MNKLHDAIDYLEKQGMQEDPRYSHLISLRARQGNAEHPRPPMQVLFIFDLCLANVQVVI